MKLTMLLIDDDEFVHRDVAMRLKSISKLQIVCNAMSVDEAADYFEKHPEGVDIIICDIMMPGKDGYEANRLFAGFFRMFIFLTQKAQHGEEIYGAASMVHYLRKPINAADVSLLLAQLEDADEQAAKLNGASGYLILKDCLSETHVFTYVNDILMVNFDEDYGKVTIRNREQAVLLNGTATAVVKRLKANGPFVRINGHCIISPEAIREIDKNMVVYFHFGGYERVTRTYQPAFRKFMKRYWMGK